jgi:RimJ/RimL family protein N-acetyltransferase
MWPTPQPVLETERLILRPLKPADAKTVQQLAGEFAIADTTMEIPHPYPDGAAEEFIASHPAKYNSGEAVNFGIILKDNLSVIGDIGLVKASRFRRAEMGYWIAKPFWNQGYATEAARAVIDFGFESLALHKIVARHFSRNPASGRVLQKLGFVQEGLLRDQVMKWDRFEDEVICALISARSL